MQLFSIVDNRRHRVIDRVEARSHDEALDKYATSIGVSLMEIESDCEHSHVSVAPSLTVVTARRLMTTMLWPGKYLVFEGGRRIKTREIEAPQLCDVDYVVRHLDHGRIVEFEGARWWMFHGLAGERGEWRASEFRDSLMSDYGDDTEET